MAIEIKIPGVGESVQEAVLAEWFKKDGDFVRRDEPLFVIETDKVTLEIVAEADGVLKILVAEGETVAIGAVVGSLETSAGEKAAAKPSESQKEEPAPETSAVSPAPVEIKPGETKPIEIKSGETKPADSKSADANILNQEKVFLSPSVRRLIAEKNLDSARINGTGPGGRITKGDVLLYLEQAPAGIPERLAPPVECVDPALTPDETEIRKPMTPIRKRIAARLLEAKQNTAMLTTFNEVDMSMAMSIRSKYKEAFKKKHDINLGFMSFFIRACVEALKEIPEVNAFIDGNDIVYHNYQHIGVAIGSPKGLVVPVIRHAERMGFAETEKAIIEYVGKIKNNRLELADLEGGTFTVSNGGVYGSLLSTPILNIPQSGILGMHKIEKRPVVVDDEIVIRPMMYLALSYDHRIVDGREAVTFLKRIKEFIENPERILLEV
ncbi:2-oxoglutarate dehydrogenase complex dihydrolipoyllysine-residue succinyltransferase [Desulfobacterales bacterium HSG16]|nr:2-oxoglutarate dehydrogenase complex dihydrolipoyllysine-residue succinyltransferase [Desulfobacterales bacterium HSG16]